MKDFKELKVGDYVIVHFREKCILDKVQKITPKGFIKVDDILFDNIFGWERGGNTFFKRHISIPENEEIESILYSTKVKSLKNRIEPLLYSCNNVSLLEIIFNMLEKEKEN